MRRLIIYYGIGLLTFIAALLVQTAWSERGTIFNRCGAEIIKGMD